MDCNHSKASLSTRKTKLADVIKANLFIRGRARSSRTLCCQLDRFINHSSCCFGQLFTLIGLSSITQRHCEFEWVVIALAQQPNWVPVDTPCQQGNEKLPSNTFTMTHFHPPSNERMCAWSFFLSLMALRRCAHVKSDRICANKDCSHHNTFTNTTQSKWISCVCCRVSSRDMPCRQ